MADHTSGYASATSVVAGSSINFHLSGNWAASFILRIERVVSGTPSTGTFSVSLLPQQVPAVAAWEGFGWPVSYTFVVPASWPTGLYQLVEDGSTAILYFVVRPSVAGQTSRILVHVSFLTPQAYNSDGGKSLYDFNSSDHVRARQVSFERTSGQPDVELVLLGWLETEGYVVECCSSLDLHDDPTLLSAYECLLVAGHDEYWTKEMRDQVERFIANGGNVVVLSGNTCYRQVRLEQNNRMLVFHKYAGQDPFPDNDRTTVAWAEPPVNRPQNSFLGAGWTHGAFGGPPSAYTIHFPSHWVFQGVSFSSGPTPQTEAFMHYETDAAAFVIEPEGYPRVTGEEGTPLSYVVLGSADLRAWGGKPGMATMGLLKKSGTVFHGGTTEWVSQLQSNPTMQQITRNVLNRLCSRLPWDWEHIGHANLGRALTALNDKLYIATTENRLWRRFPVGADIVWRDIGHAEDVGALAASGDSLFCITVDNQLWCRESVDFEVNWIAFDSGPAAGTKALAAAGGVLYAVDSKGKLWRRPASRVAAAWVTIPSFTADDPRINALASYSNILFASTTDNRLVRSNQDWIYESSEWTDIHHCNFSAGLAVVDGMLFVATIENRLWWLDLHGLRQP